MNHTIHDSSIHSLPALMEQIVKLSNALERKPRRFGTDVLISSSELHTLEIIGDRSGLSVTELARILGITKGAVSQTLKRLEGKALVRKETDSENLSRIKIKLTSKGEIAYSQHRSWHQEMDGGFKAYFESMNKQEIGFLQDVLNQVASFLKKRLESE